jgi:NhaA family Na+:H+ antiporter
MINRFIQNEAAGGIVLMIVAALALVVANSGLSPLYFATLKTYVGGLSILHWINDALMAVFFLLVGLEIKREVLEGQLSTWPDRALPGLAALGGIIVPALVYLFFTWGRPMEMRGWAIPAATDIAFALGVLALLGSRVPASMKIFLTALAIIDDLAAVIIIALFYTSDLSGLMLLAAFAGLAVLLVLNRLHVTRLWPYLLVGVAVWYFVLKSGVHATLAGVAVALLIPLRVPGDTPEDDSDEEPPLLRLEHALHRPVAFGVVPIFGFANAGVSFAGMTPAVLLEPVPLAIAAGLFLGKLVGVFGAMWLTIKAGLARLPDGAGWRDAFGVAMLCGIGFTMSLFIGLLAFPGEQQLQDAVKIGVLAGSGLAGLCGYALLRLSSRRLPAA